MPVILIIMIFAFIGTADANELWIKYDLPDSINCITNYGDNIWAGTQNGVVKMNRNDGNLTIYTSGRDSLAEKYVNYITTDLNGNIFAGSKTLDLYRRSDYPTGGISIFDGISWKIYRKDVDGLSGNGIMGLKRDINGIVWAASNDNYFDIINLVRTWVYRIAIQYYDNSLWKTKYIKIQNFDTTGDWGEVWMKNWVYLNYFDISDSTYFLYGLGHSVYNTIFLYNNAKEIYFLASVGGEYSGYLQSVNNFVIEKKNENNIIYINGTFENSAETIALGTPKLIGGIEQWTPLSSPFTGCTHTPVQIVIDESHNKWFVDKDESNNKYLIKYDDVNYLPYTCPSWTDSTEITCLYVDDQGYVWIGTVSDGLWRFDARNATSVESTQQSPATFTLSTAYPNPFNASTTINFNLNEPGKVNLAVYSLTGQKVRELAAGNYSAGSHTVVWDGCDNNGTNVSSGVYLARMESGGVSKVVRMAMVK